MHRRSGRCSGSNTVLHLFIHTVVGEADVNGIGSAACAYPAWNSDEKGEVERERVIEERRGEERRERERGRKGEEEPGERKRIEDRLGNSGYFSVFLLQPRTSSLSHTESFSTKQLSMREGERGGERGSKGGEEDRPRGGGRYSDIHEGCDRARWYDNWRWRWRRERRAKPWQVENGEADGERRSPQEAEEEHEEVEEDVEAEGGGYHGYQKPQSPPPTMREVSLTPGKATAHQHAAGVRARTYVLYVRPPTMDTGTCEGGGPRHYKHALRDTACEVPFRSIAAAKPTLRS